MATKTKAKSRRGNLRGTTNKMGQYKLKEKVRCDECGYEWQPTVKELMLTNDLRIVSGFVCKKCGKEYVVSVTDNNLRANIAKANDLNAEITKLTRSYKNEVNEMKRIRGYMPGDIEKRYLDKLQSMKQEYMDLVRANQERGVKLKKEYLAKRIVLENSK